MKNRQQELAELREYIRNIDKETSLLLQNLQWDHKHLVESPSMVACKYDCNHRIPLDSRDAHEKQCFLAQQGYTKEDVLLPDPIDPDASTVVKLGKQDIIQIINAASSTNPSFKRGIAHPGVEPLSAERLQLLYTADERRAIHDAVVNTAPFCHDLTDLALASSSEGAQGSKVKSRAEVLAELRDMKRRRVRYRVAANTTNYSHVLRDVIKTQMELYSESKGIVIKTEYGPKTYVSLNKPKERNQDKYVPPPIMIKQERITPELDNYSESSRRYRERSRDRHYDNHRKLYDDRESASKRRRDHYEKDTSSDRKRFKDASEERRCNDYDQLKKDRYSRTKEQSDTFEDRSRYGHSERKYNKTQELNVSKDSQRYDEDRRKHTKHERNQGIEHLDTNKYVSDYRKYDKHDRSHKDSCKDSSKNDYYSRKHETYQRTYKDSDRHREKERNKYCDVKIKQEIDDDYND